MRHQCEMRDTQRVRTLATVSSILLVWPPLLARATTVGQVRARRRTREWQSKSPLPLIHGMEARLAEDVLKRTVRPSAEETISSES